MKFFSIVVAMDDHRGIGIKGQLPWQLSADLKHFREITTTTKDSQKQNIVVMGRKTWESLPPRFKPLPNRINVVLSKQTNYELPSGVYRFESFEAFEKWIETDIKKKYENCFVIGGQQIFEDALKRSECQALYITHIKKTFVCDTFFPAFDLNFSVADRSLEHKEGDLAFFFAEYRRKE